MIFQDLSCVKTPPNKRILQVYKRTHLTKLDIQCSATAENKNQFDKMFKILFAVFAFLAVAFAAPSPNPNPAVVAAAPLAYSSLGYGGYVAPVAYSSYPHVAAVPGAYAYGTPVVYG